MPCLAHGRVPPRFPPTMREAAPRGSLRRHHHRPAGDNVGTATRAAANPRCLVRRTLPPPSWQNQRRCWHAYSTGCDSECCTSQGGGTRRVHGPVPTRAAACVGRCRRRRGGTNRGAGARIRQAATVSAVQVGGGGRAACTGQCASPAGRAPRLTLPVDILLACGGAHPPDADQPPCGGPAPRAAGAAAALRCQQARDGRLHPRRRVGSHPRTPSGSMALAAQWQRPTQGHPAPGICHCGARPFVTRRGEADYPPTHESVAALPASRVIVAPHNIESSLYDQLHILEFRPPQ